MRTQTVYGSWVRRIGLAAAALMAVTVLSGAVWFQSRYDDSPEQTVELKAFTNAEYPEDPEDRSRAFGNYPHGSLIIQQTGDTRFRFLIKPASNHATSIELVDVDLRHIVTAVPPWVKSDPDLTKVGLIDREWNRQQVRFRRDSPYVRVHEGGDGFELQALTHVDLARNCLNAGLWELLLFTTEDGEDRVYEHVWFTFPLGLYKNLFQPVNGLSYWDYWWSLEHWVDPSGTPIRLDRLRTVEREWEVTAVARWDESPQWRGEQLLKRRNVLAPPVHTFRDWYTQPIQFASFIPPGRYSVKHPRDTQLHYLAEFTGAVLRQVYTPAGPQSRHEIELGFRDNRTGERTRLIIGGLDLGRLPVTSLDRYELGWQVPLGIGNPGFFESYEENARSFPAPTSFLRIPFGCTRPLDGPSRGWRGRAVASLGCKRSVQPAFLPPQLRAPRLAQPLRPYLSNRGLSATLKGQFRFSVRRPVQCLQHTTAAVCKPGHRHIFAHTLPMAQTGPKST